MGVLLILLGGEAAFLGLRFDAGGLVASNSPAARVVGGVLGRASTLLITLAAASMLLGSRRWAEVLASLRVGGRPKRFLSKLLVHLACFAGLVYASRCLFEGAQGRLSEIVAWTVALLATVGTWLLLWGPWSILRRLPWQLTGVLAGSLVLGTAAYANGQLSQHLWGPMRSWTFALAAPLSRIFVSTIEVDPETSTIGAGSFFVDIAPACSGYEGVGLTLTFLAVFFWLFRARLRLLRVSLLVIPILGLVWLLNVLRIVALVVIGIRVSPGLALGSFHSYVGALVVLTVNLAVMLAILHTPALLRAPGDAQTARYPFNECRRDLGRAK